MIEIDDVTRENFDNSGLSNGYSVATTVGDTETEILRLIKSVFEGIPNLPMRDLDPNKVRTDLLAAIASLQSRSIALFQAARESIFTDLNKSIRNGFEAGKRSGAAQLKVEPSDTSLEDITRGEETIKLANGSMLKAMALAVQAAVRGAAAAVTLLTVGEMAQAEFTFRDAYDIYVVPQFEAGLPGKTTVDGRDISLVSYAETVTRESSQTALLIGESTEAKNSGYPLVLISAHYACCPLCEPWQNAVLVDDIWADGKPDGVHKLLSEAVHAGLFHPNCRHLKRIYIPGRTFPNNPPNYDPDKVAVNYELEQIQRRLEREIRNKKRKLEMSLTDEERSRAEAAIRDKQAQLRGLVRFADKNGYKVYRQNWKEQIDFEKKPTYPYETPEGLTKPTESGIMEIHRNQATGRASAIRLMDADLNKRQKKLLERLDKAGDSLEAAKSQIKTKDIAALTAKEGVEFALFTKGNRRLIVRGDSFKTPVGETRLRQLAVDGWKFSAHTHPTVGGFSLTPSPGDIKVLYLFNQGESVIYNASGNFERFFKE